MPNEHRECLQRLKYNHTLTISKLKSKLTKLGL